MCIFSGTGWHWYIALYPDYSYFCFFFGAQNQTKSISLSRWKKSCNFTESKVPTKKMNKNSQHILTNQLRSKEYSKHQRSSRTLDTINRNVINNSPLIYKLRQIPATLPFTQWKCHHYFLGHLTFLFSDQCSKI